MDIQSIEKILKASDNANDTVLIEGKHGIGKSNIVEQYANNNDYHLEILYLSSQEVGDIIGNPRTVEIDGEHVTTWTVPVWLQRMRKAADAGKHCVLFLDELNRAALDVRQCAIPLVLEGRIHEHWLPVNDGNKTFIVAAINPADEYQVDELDPALLDRFLTVTAEVDVKCWINWAKRSGIADVIVDFIVEHPDRLHYTPAEGRGATPRSWAKLSSYKFEDTPREILFQLIKGKVGSEVGSQFYSFFMNYSKVIKVEDIEKIVNEESEQTNNIEEIAESVKDLISKTEAIQQTELAHKLKDKYGNEKNMLPFLVYLYSLNIEILVGFLKGLKSDNPDMYANLAAIDGAINNKELFRKIIVAADRT